MSLTVDRQSTYFHERIEQTVGQWEGSRTYESVKTGKITQVSNRFEVTLDRDEAACRHLEQLHALPSETFPYIIHIYWKSHDRDTRKLLSEGSMLMGYHNGWLYRNRGYVTDMPVLSQVEMPSPDHMLIRTFYEGVTTLGDETVAYEENFRWAGDHRLRTVLAWDKNHQLTLMGQYMERKLAA
ncbi:phycobiliprotein lyase [Oscillatoriales cyanobacterium LEGE 11467]|uniref:Phycobiliprotein lyase n=1 Tax=Zarconia navalis LEGE 11467 TaxID=1828826 RepID=A0A928VZM7_9CYAN|nr:phycobiliprotein lyase [Zarconia navalis]MBE9042554.1 phycobiliprotein lyase [Zarconia navalis LEGE 11467]